MTAPMLQVHNPADGSVVGEVVDTRPEEVARTVAGLRHAQPEWEALGARVRARWLKRYRDWLLDNEDRLAGILQSETGKPWAEACLEVPYIIDLINYYGAHAEQFLADETPGPHGMMTATRRQHKVLRPHPVVGVITPWNFPLALALIDGCPALLAGAAVVIKPSEFTPLVTAAAVQGWADIGAPDVFACVTGSGATGAAVVDEVDYLQFTGSTRTGRVIAQRAGERLIPYSLELGGKDAMLVLDDANVKRAANGAVWGSMANAGQMCTSVERVYVDDVVYDEFVERVVEKVEALRVGSDDKHYSRDVGALANENQVAIVSRHVDDAIERGAKALTGGSRGATGTYFEPTVLVGVDHTMVCMREETFGPVIPIMRVSDEDEAIRLANDSSYGLSASVWSSDADRAERVARRLEAGAVNINDMFGNLFSLPVPQAGWKTSGIGSRLGGPDGIRKFCRSQAIVASKVTLASEPHWYPYSRLKGTALRTAARLIGARDLRRKFRRS